MIENIYSKIESNLVLHMIHKPETSLGRIDLVNSDNFIQCSSLVMQKGKTFNPHRHIVKERHFNHFVAQESWVVIRGKVRCIFYDLDNSVLCERVICSGEASFTLHGGHNYEILEDDTFVYEYKTGPYEGVELDKVFIEG